MVDLNKFLQREDFFNKQSPQVFPDSVKEDETIIPVVPPTVTTPVPSQTEDPFGKLRKSFETIDLNPLPALTPAPVVDEPSEEDKSWSEDDLKKVAGDIGTTIFHPVGTCAMGTNVSSVTDSNLKVRGVEGLRIADASIMPTITSGNTNAPTLMIAEKASEMILNSNKI